MRTRWLSLKFAFNGQTLRNRILFSLGLPLAITGIWFNLFLKPIQSQISPMTSKVTTVEKNITTVETSLVKLKKKNKPKRLPNYNLIRQRLTSSIARLERESKAVLTQIATGKQTAKLLAAILQRPEGLEITSFYTDKPEALSSGEDNSEDALFRNTIHLEFSGKFFQTTGFFEKLENLGVSFFWEKCSYVVTKYPNAKVTLQLTVLSRGGGVLNAK